MANDYLPQIDCEKVITDVATSLIKDATGSAWDKIKSFFKDLDVKDQIRYGSAYNEYLTNVQAKYGKIKTLIYRHIPKDLYSFYECIGVKYSGKIVSTSSVNNLLSIGHKIIITGTGGIGKSILFKHLLLNSVKETNFIPVLIELRSFNSLDTKEISMHDAIYKILTSNGFCLDEKYYDYSLSEGGYLVLLDGFDEINRDRVNKVTSEVKNFCSKYNKNHFIISSRPTDAFIGWNDFSEMSACALTKEQALNLIKKIDYSEPAKSTFYQELDNNLYDKYKSFASNPLLLTIMLLTFCNHASIPAKLNDFYEAAFSTLFNMHDATKDCYVRDTRTNLGIDEFKTIFSYICFKSYFCAEYEFTESELRHYIQMAKEKFSSHSFLVDDFLDDLVSSVCMLFKDGLNYRFSHRSFQEYFAAWYTCKLTDEAQYKLLTSWMTESNSVITDEYLTMLFNLQPEKVNKVILCPGIKDIKHMYEICGYSKELLEQLFDNISIRRTRKSDGTIRYHLSLLIKDRYLCNIIRMTCKLNCYSYQTAVSHEELEQELATRLVKYLKKSNRKIDECPISTAFELVNPKELLDVLKWFESQLLFSLSILEKNSDTSINRKRKLSSIIEEL